MTKEGSNSVALDSVAEGADRVVLERVAKDRREGIGKVPETDGTKLSTSRGKDLSFLCEELSSGSANGDVTDRDREEFGDDGGDVAIVCVSKAEDAVGVETAAVNTTLLGEDEGRVISCSGLDDRLEEDGRTDASGAENVVRGG